MTRKSGMPRITALILVHHEGFRKGLARLLKREPVLGHVHEAKDPALAARLAARTKPELIVIDSFQLGAWPNVCLELHRVSPSSRLVVLHSYVSNQPGTPGLDQAYVTHLTKNVRSAELVDQLLNGAPR